MQNDAAFFVPAPRMQLPFSYRPRFTTTRQTLRVSSGVQPTHGLEKYPLASIGAARRKAGTLR
jgi:hypothetical protein